MAIGTIAGLSLLASILGKGISAAKNRGYQRKSEEAAKAQEEEQKRLRLRDAMARNLGMDTQPFISTRVKRPEMPSTAWSDMLGALGQYGAQYASQKMGERAYPVSGGSRIKQIPRYTNYEVM